ncbi:MAG: hypothetical protein ACOX7N_06180 [Lawsonibacter sp.]|jgi:hypothetical protein
MTPEYLLDAIGLLDDDLLQDAWSSSSLDTHSPQDLRPILRRVGSFAACLVLLLSVGYVLTHFQLGNTSSGSTSASADSGEATAGEGAAGSSSIEESNGSASPEETYGNVFLDQHTYQITEETLSSLPEGTVALGTLSALYPDAPSPNTDRKDYVDCPVFQSSDGKQLYVQIAEDVWVVAKVPPDT